MRGRGDSSSFVVWNCCQLANNMEQVVGVGVKDGVIIMSIRLGGFAVSRNIFTDPGKFFNRFHMCICLF